MTRLSPEGYSLCFYLLCIWASVRPLQVNPVENMLRMSSSHERLYHWKLSSHFIASLPWFYFFREDWRRWMDNKLLLKTWSWWTLWCRAMGGMVMGGYHGINSPAPAQRYNCEAGGNAHQGEGNQDHSFWGLNMLSTLKYRIIIGLDIHGVSLDSDENASTLPKFSEAPE